MRKEIQGFVVGTFLVLGLLVGYGKSQSTSQGYENKTVTEVKVQLDQGEDVILIDVRTPAEFVGALGHISGALLKPLSEIDKWVDEFAGRKDRKIVVVCRSGNRSRVASQYLAKQGFRSVVNMTGGMRAWKEKKYPVTMKPVEEQK